VNEDPVKKAAYMVVYREAHREEIAAMGAAYQAAHREELASKRAVYRAAHLEKRRADSLAWHHANRERAQASLLGWRAAHRDEEAAYRASYELTHREERTAGWASYRATHQEEISAYAASHREEQAAYRFAHREEQAGLVAAWNAAHPDKRRDGNRKHNALRRGARLCDHPGCLTIGATQLAWQTNEHVCWMCGVPVMPGGNLHMDHVVPLAAPHFGLHCAENLRPACADCNLRKGANLWGES
jgi:5-methylcytosine-specific restriction endonuclease McrA